MKHVKSVFLLLRILSDDMRLSMTHLIIWLWLLRMAFSQSIDAYAIGIGVLVLLFWGVERLMEFLRQKKLSDEERESVENLSNRLSMIESALALNEQRRMF